MDIPPSQGHTSDARRAPESPHVPPEPAPAPPAARSGWNLYRFLIVGAVAPVFAGLGAFFRFDAAALFHNLAADPFFLAMWLVGVAGAVLLAARARAWTYLLASLLVSLMPLLVTITFGWRALQDPASGLPFMGAALYLLALLLAVPAGVLGFRAARLDRPTPTLTKGWRTPHGAFAIAASAMVVVSIALSAAAHGGASGGNSGVFFQPEDVGADATSLVTELSRFQPKDLNVSANKLTRVRITNLDAATHTFTYELNGRTYSVELLGGTETDAWVYFASAGTVRFRCVPHSANYDDVGGNMVGTMTVADVDPGRIQPERYLTARILDKNP